MNKYQAIAAGAAIFAVGNIVGYKMGMNAAEKIHKKWQETHKFYCWKPKKNGKRIGDWPAVFVIENYIPMEDESWKDARDAEE